MSPNGRTLIVVAIISLIGTIGAALISILGSLSPQSQKADRGNPLLRGAGIDYSDLIENVKIRFEGFDVSTSSEFTGVPHLIFSFTNLSPKTIGVAGSMGCDLINWKYIRAGRLRGVTKTASLNQNGPHIIRIPAQATKKISYSIYYFDSPAFFANSTENSVCRFHILFGQSHELYTATALSNSPLE